MSRRQAIGFVARQAGTAQAFAPAVRELTRRGVPTRTLAFDPAWETLDRSGVEAVRVASAVEGLVRLEETGRPGFLLCGTSEHAEEDARFWRWAQREGVLHAAFLDSWINYWQRFTSPDGPRFDLLPDEVAVPDDAAKGAMIARGCPAGAIAVTGSPAFDAWTRLDPAPGRRWRVDLLRPAETLLFSFVLEPLAEVYGADPSSDGHPGYTEREALTCALAALARLAARRGTEICLAVQPHPRQGLTSVRAMVAGLIRSCPDTAQAVRVVVDRFDRAALVGGSDTILGMTSMLLYEASLAGRPVISLQPDRRRGSDLTDLHPGIVVVTEPRMAMDAVGAAVAATAPPAGGPGGTSRLVEYLLGHGPGDGADSSSP